MSEKLRKAALLIAILLMAGCNIVTPHDYPAKLVLFYPSGPDTIKVIPHYIGSGPRYIMSHIEGSWVDKELTKYSAKQADGSWIEWPPVVLFKIIPFEPEGEK